MNSPVLSIKEINFRYNTIDVLKNISFDVAIGDFVGLIGHNGSGKTTLVKILLGLLTETSGEVRIFGENVRDFKAWKKVGYMPQTLSSFSPIFPSTVSEVVSLGLLSEKRFPKRLSHRDEKRVRETLSEFDVLHLKDRMIGNLSGGQLQKVFLAKTLITRPELLILDEPSSALDASTREQFFELLNRLNRHEKTTIVMVTHDMTPIEKFASKVVYIDSELIYDGDISGFKKLKNIKDD